jgi:hypothetical protein
MKKIIIIAVCCLVLLPCKGNSLEPEYLDSLNNNMQTARSTGTFQFSSNNLLDDFNSDNTYKLSLNKYLAQRNSQFEIILNPSDDNHYYNHLLEQLYIFNSINQEGPRPEGLTFSKIMKSTAYGALYGLALGGAFYLIYIITNPGEDAREMAILEFTAVGAGLGLLGVLLFGG